MDIESIRNLKILYVEDEIILRDTTCNALHSIIDKIEVADNGKEGLEKFQNGDFNLVISDLSMPIMNGAEMLKEIKKKDPHISVVITTAYGSQNDTIDILKEMGINEFVMKPVDIMKLLAAIEKAIKN